MEILQGIRDVAVIILALESIILGSALLFLAWQVWKIVGRVRHHLDVVAGSAQDILGTVKETAGSVKETAQSTKGTAEFVGDRAARPVIELYSAVSGASRFAQAFLNSGKRGKPE
ncbi:MAG: hypothetical protein HW416_384 [Chloroflexi bacterium]|nr:hypothetical protein [Chloroflexota bacterium]